MSRHASCSLWKTDLPDRRGRPHPLAEKRRRFCQSLAGPGPAWSVPSLVLLGSLPAWLFIEDVVARLVGWWGSPFVAVSWIPLG